MNKAGFPLLGAAYYPEAWPMSLVDEDIALMKKAGMTVMRIGEFAWNRMEPRDGRFEFKWLHEVVDKLGRAGIRTILGTPSAVPPIWLSSRHPEILFIMQDGREIPHGGRRHYCPNNPLYRRYAVRIAEKMAKEFGKDPNVIGWQIDNEVSWYGTPCCCPVCIKLFHAWLKRRFGTIAKLNEAWCNNLWSMEYLSFDQVPTPRFGIWHHPALRIAWDEFGSESYVDFAGIQADAMRRYVRQPIGTDMMTTAAVDYHDINRKLDVVQHNHYHGMEGLWEAGFWFDFCRTILRNRPFWNTETATCWNGTVTANGYKEPGFCRANSWLPIAMGGEANLYWLWRQHSAGHELMHGAVVTSQGRPMHIMEEVRGIADGFRRCAAFISGTRPDASGLAVHFSNYAQIFFEHQQVANKFKFLRDLMGRIYRPLVEGHLRPDVIHPAADLEGYKVVVSPFLPALDDHGLRRRLRKWIMAGGTWIAGPMTDIRNTDAGKFIHAPFKDLEDWAGVHTRYELPGDPRDFKLRWKGGSAAAGSIWYDAFECRGSKPLATYTDGPIKGLAAAVEKRMGKGRIILLGTVPQPADFRRLVLSACADAGILPVAAADPNLYVVPRCGAGGKGMIVVEVQNKPGKLMVPRKAIDLLTGKKCGKGRITVPPYGVMVLEDSR